MYTVMDSKTIYKDGRFYTNVLPGTDIQETCKRLNRVEEVDSQAYEQGLNDYFNRNKKPVVQEQVKKNDE